MAPGLSRQAEGGPVAADQSPAERQLVRTAMSLGRERDLSALLERVLFEARRHTNAEAGTLYLVDGDVLRSAVVQNDVLRRRVGEARMRQCLQTLPLPLTKCSLAGYVVLTRKSLHIADVYRIPRECPFIFNRSLDLRSDYRTRSVLTVPLEDRHTVLGALQLINARDDRDHPVAFSRAQEPILRWFAGEAARVIPDLRPSSSALGAAPVAPAEDAEAMEGAAPGGPIALDEQSLEAALADADVSRVPELALEERPSSVGRRLGDLLLSQKLISLEQLSEALDDQKRTQQRLGTILVRLNFLSEATLTETLSRQYRIPAVKLAGREIPPDVLALVPVELARRFCLLPIQREHSALTVAVTDPTDLSVLDHVAFNTGLAVVPVLATMAELRQKIEEVYDGATSLAAGLLSELQSEMADIEVVTEQALAPVLDVSELRTSADETPVVRVVNALLLDAIKRGASDVHFECFANSLRVRSRVDGILQEVMSPAKRLHPAIVSRIKIMADLDIAERRLPQDGRTKLRVHGREIDLRVSVIPTIFGESVDIRILDGARVKPDLAQLGLTGSGLEDLLTGVQEPNGVILITGPTGSGKSTTLYSLVELLNQRNLKILTIEDPVEYVVEGVNQVNVNEAIGRTFAGTLRSFLRHDPDVILVGEMRDQETAEVAVRAGLTGHLVLSTLHTNDCPSTIVRLMDMGVAPFLLSAALRCIIAQRLLRRVCEGCRQPHDVAERKLAEYGAAGVSRGTTTVYRARGCAACGHTGFRGRIGIFEVMPLTADLRQLVAQGGTADAFRDAARKSGVRSLREAALDRLFAGETTLEEVGRMTSLEPGPER